MSEKISNVRYYEVEYELTKGYKWVEEARVMIKWPHDGHKIIKEEGRKRFDKEEEAMSFGESIIKESVGSSACVYVYYEEDVPESIRDSAKEIKKLLENMDYYYHDDRPTESQGCSTGQSDMMEAVSGNIESIFDLTKIGKCKRIYSFFGEKDEKLITCRDCGKEHIVSSEDCEFLKSILNMYVNKEDKEDKEDKEE